MAAVVDCKLRRSETAATNLGLSNDSPGGRCTTEDGRGVVQRLPLLWATPGLRLYIDAGNAWIPAPGKVQTFPNRPQRFGGKLEKYRPIPIIDNLIVKLVFGIDLQVSAEMGRWRHGRCRNCGFHLGYRRRGGGRWNRCLGGALRRSFVPSYGNLLRQLH